MTNQNDDAAVDRYHDGYDAHRNGKPCPACPDGAQGWHDREHQTKTRVTMPERPEGYYHMPIGTFD